MNRKFITGTKQGDLLYFFELIISDISILGSSLRKALENRMSMHTFLKMCDNDDDKMHQYTRAFYLRADKLAEDILTISDENNSDTIYTEKGQFENREWVNRSRLRVESRKWLMSKMHPRKYGDRVDITSGGEKIKTSTTIIKWGDNEIKV